MNVWASCAMVVESIPPSGTWNKMLGSACCLRICYKKYPHLLVWCRTWKIQIDISYCFQIVDRGHWTVFWCCFHLNLWHLLPWCDTLYRCLLRRRCRSLGHWTLLSSNLIRCRIGILCLELLNHFAFASVYRNSQNLVTSFCANSAVTQTNSIESVNSLFMILAY